MPQLATEPATFPALRQLPVPARELIAGGIAGAAAKSVIAPLERCKILFQTGKLRGARLAPTLSHIWQTEGVPGLFRGNGAAVLRIVPYAAVHYWAYEHYRRALVGAGVLGAQEHHVPPVLDLLAGSAAGASAVVLTYPLDLVRTRLAFMTEAGGSGARLGAVGSSSSGAGSRVAALSSLAATPAAVPAAGAAAASSGSSSGAMGGRLPPQLHYARTAVSGGGTAFVLASSRGCSSGACSGSSTLASSGAGRLVSGLTSATAAASSVSSSCCGSRLQGQGPARGLHVLPLSFSATSGPGAAAVPAATALHQQQHNIRSMLASTLRQEGLRGLYHGVGASLYGILPYAGLKFYCYQHLKQHYHHTHPGVVTRTGVDGKPRLPVPVMLSFGAVAGLVAQTVTYPFDVVRRQMQVEGLKLREAAANSPALQLAGAKGSPTRQLSLRSTPQALLLLGRTHGWRCLYAGLAINYLKVVPSTAIGFTLYDFMKSALALPTNL